MQARAFWNKCFNYLERLSNLAGTWLIVCLMFLVTSNVFSRYFTGKELLGAYELSTLLLVGIIFFSISYTQNVKKHVTVEVLISRLKNNTLAAFEIFALLISLFVVSLLFYRSLLETITAVNINMISAGIIRWPVWPFKIIVSFGFLLFCIRLVIQLVQRIRGLEVRNSNDID